MAQIGLRRVVIDVWGADPVAARQIGGLMHAYGLTASGGAAPDDRRSGLSGDPVSSSYADVGAIQSFAVLKGNGGRNANRRGEKTALPSSGGRQLSKAKLLMGQQGI